MGAILFGTGLLFLIAQYTSTTQLLNIASQTQMESKDLYQQENNTNINNISDNELYAIIIGYREYPIIIDGNVIKTDETDYEYCFSLIRKGYYVKSYECNEDNEIIRIIYTYINHL